MISRRAFVASSVLAGVQGCGLRSKPLCILGYTNLTSSWISGRLLIGSIVRESVSLLPLGSTSFSAQRTLIEGEKYRFHGIDCFKNTKLSVEGVISNCPSNIEQPFCHLLILKNSKISFSWIDRLDRLEVDNTIQLVDQNITFRFLIWRRPENFLLAHLGIRQRPVAHGTIVGRDYRIDKGPHTELGVRWIVDPAMSSQCVFSFTYIPNQDPAHCWRIPVDFNQPQFRPHRESGNLWVETTLDGQLQIGHFDTPAQSTRELDSLLQTGNIPVPRDFISLQALKQPFFQMPLYDQEATSQMVDLRFDDER